MRSVPATGPDAGAPSSLREQLETFERQGFLFVRRLVTPGECFGLRRVLEDKLQHSGSGNSLEQDPRLKFAVTENPRARDLLLRIVTRGQVLPLIAELHSDPYIEHAKALVKRPSAPATPWHQDSGYWHDMDPQDSMVTLWIALTRIARDNGCMRLLEGSHRNGIHPHVRTDEHDLAIPEDVSDALVRSGVVRDAALEPGDALFFHCKLLHSAWPNGSGEPRMAFKVAFQDRTQRKSGLRHHATKLEIPRFLDEVGPVTRKRSLKKRAVEAAKVLGPPFSTAVESIQRLGRRKSKTFTQAFKPLRQFQIKGSEREWHQLFFYHELLHRIEGVPGDVAEFGVAGGISILSMVRILRLLEPDTDPRHRRMLYGFDSFEGLPELAPEDAVRHGGEAEMKKGGFYDPGGYGDLFAFAEDKANNLRLIKGWFNETLPVFLANQPATAFALVHVDCDLYESTKTVLSLLWERVVPGGVVAFDELFHPDFPGETVAFREFAAERRFTIHQSRMWPSKKYIVKLEG